MSALSAGMSRPGEMILFLAIAFLIICCSRAAPVSEHDTTNIAEYGVESGCYYNFQRYQEGDRIVTNEPCLNCTCHNRMLMCYLRVCPFTKAIGQNCTVEKRPDQCCPIITCPEVPVQLLTSTPNSPAIIGSTEIGAHDNYGCRVDEKFYADGAQLPVDPRNPCELCYCIRNRTTCVMQECTLRVAGCNPVYLPGVCCPVKYNCDYDEEQTTTISPTTPGLIMTTTVAPGQSTPMCYRDGNAYNDGELIDSGRACQHCYCFRGDIVCAVQDCKIPMKIHGKHCTPQPAPEGKCCSTTYQCDGESSPTEVEEEPQLSGGLPIPDHPYKEQATGEVFPGADNSIPEQTGENQAVTEGPIKQENEKSDGETSTELPGDVKDKIEFTENLTKVSVVEAEGTSIKSSEDTQPTEVASSELPALIGEEQPVTTADEGKEAPHGSIEHDNKLQATVTADEIQTEVNVDKGEPISPVESTDRTVSEDSVKTTEDLPTHVIVSEDEIEIRDELPTKEAILERPTPTEITSQMQESNEGSGDDQILREPMEPEVEQKMPEGVSSEGQKPSEVPAISKPQEPVTPLSENDEIAVEESTVMPTQVVKSEEEVTQKPVVIGTELKPTEDVKTEDSIIVNFPGEVELTKPKPSEESIPSETSTLKTTELGVPEQSIKETAMTFTSVDKISVLPERHENESEETPASATILPTMVSADEDKSTDESGSIEGHTIDHSIMVKEPTQHESDIAGTVPASEVLASKVPTSEIQTDVIPTDELTTGEVPTSEVTIGEVPSNQDLTDEVPSPDEVSPQAPSESEVSKTQSEGSVIDEKHPVELIVAEEKQPEDPIVVETPSEPAAHDHENSVDIPEQGPTGIPISDRVPVVKAEDESVVHEMHVTEVYDEVQHTHVPDSLIIDKQDEIPITYIPPITPTAESEITPGQDQITTVVAQEVVPHEKQAPQISNDTVTLASFQKEHEQTPHNELEYEKSTVIGQLPTEATQTEVLLVEHVTDEQENGDKQIFDTSSGSDVKVPESHEVSTEDQEVELEGLANAKPTESQEPANGEQHHVPVENENLPTKTTAKNDEKPLEPTADLGEIVEGEQQTEEPVVNDKLLAGNVAEEKPLEVPTHDEKTPELPSPEGILNGAPEDERKPVTDSALAEKPTKSPEHESEPTEILTTDKELLSTPVPAKEPLTPLIPEERPSEPVVADEKQTEIAISQEQLTEGPISNENPIGIGITTEDQLTEASISQEQEDGALINAEAPNEINSDAEEKPNDKRIAEEKPTEASIIQEELTTVAIIDQKSSDESAVEQKLTEVSVSEEVPTQASSDVENPVEPSSTDEKLIDISATDKSRTKTPVGDDESNVTPISEEKPTTTFITGEISTQTSVAEEKPSNADEKPNKVSIMENNVTDIPKSEQEPTGSSIVGREPTISLGINEKPTSTSFVSQKVTDVFTFDGEPTEPSLMNNGPTVTSIDEKTPIEVSDVETRPNRVTVVEQNPTESSIIHEKETSIPAAEELTESPVTEQKIFVTSATPATPTESSVQEEGITNIPSGSEILTEESVTGTKTPMVVIGEEKVTEISTEEGQNTVASVTDEKPTGVSETEQRVTDSSIIEQELTEASIIEHETTSSSIEEGETSGTAIAEVNSEAGSVIAVGQAELTTIKSVETPSTDNEPVTPSVVMEGPVDTSAIDQKPIESSTPTNEQTETVIPQQEPTKSSDTGSHFTESSVVAEKDALAAENEPTHETNVKEEQTNIPVSEEAMTDKIVVELESTGATVTEQKPTGTAFMEQKPTEISVTDEKITNPPVTEMKPSDASVAEEQPTNTPVSNIKEIEPAKKGSTTISESGENLDKPLVVAKNPIPASIGEETLIEPLIVAEKPTESTAVIEEVTESFTTKEGPTMSSSIQGSPTESSIVEEKPTESTEIAGKPASPSIPEEKTTKIPIADEKAESEVKLSGILQIVGNVPQSAVSEEQPTEVSMSDDELVKIPLSEVKPIKIEKPEEGPVETSTPEKHPIAHSVTPVTEGKITEVSESQENLTEPSNAESVPTEIFEGESAKPSVVEKKPINSMPSQATLSGESPSDEKPTETAIIPEESTKVVQEGTLPIEPSTEDKQPFTPSLEEQKPINPSVSKKQPIEPSIGEQQPNQPSVEEQQPSEPSQLEFSETPSQTEEEDRTTIEQERPEVFGDNSLSSIPGEGNCLVDGQSFANNSRIPPANLCQTQCLCISSIVHCDLVECSPPPSHLSNCMPIHTNAESCCPIYSCDSTSTVNLESDSQMAEIHTPGYEGVHVPPTDDDSKESSTPIIEYPVEPSGTVTPGPGELPSILVDEGTTPSIESIADLDQKIVEPMKQEIPKRTVPIQEPSGVSEANGIPEQPIIDQTKQNPKPEVVDKQTKDEIIPTEHQKPISEEKQKPESPIEPSEFPVKAVTTYNEPNIIPVTTIDESTTTQQPDGIPTSDKKIPLVLDSLITNTNGPFTPVNEENPEVIPASEGHPVELGTSGEEQTNDNTKQHKPTVEIKTVTDQPATTAGEDVGPEETHAASEKPIDNGTVLSVEVLEEGDQVVDIFQPTENVPTKPVFPVDKSTGESENHSENTEHPETSVTGDTEQTPGFTESVATSPVLATDQPIVESITELSTLIGQHPEKYVPQPQHESNGQVIEPSKTTDASSSSKDQLELQQQPEKGEEEVPTESSTHGSQPEFEAPVSTGSSQNQSVSTPLPTDGVILSNNAGTSATTPAGQVEHKIEGSTVIPVEHIDGGVPILSSQTEAAEDEILPTETSKQGEFQTPVSGVYPQEATAPTTQSTVRQELPIGSEATTSTEEKHDYGIAETEPSIILSPPDTTKVTEASEISNEQTTALNKQESEPISHETSPISVLESGESVDAVPESHDVVEPSPLPETTEGQVTEVKETGEPVNPQGAESSEPTANTEDESTGVEEPATRPISSEEEIRKTVIEESLIAEQGESFEPPVTTEGERIDIEIATTVPAISKEGTKPIISEISGEDHKTPIPEFMTEPASPETAETLAPTMHQEDKTVAAEYSTINPVLIGNAEKPISSVHVEGQTIRDAEKPTGLVPLQPVKSSEATENIDGDRDTDKKPISETELPNQDATTGEPEVSLISTLPAVTGESEAVTLKPPSMQDVSQSGTATRPPTTSSEVPTLVIEDSESVLPDQDVTAASGASGEEDTTPAQQPAIETLVSGTKRPIPSENAEEQMIPVQDLDLKPASPDHPKEPVAILQPGIVSASPENTEEFTPTEGIEKEIIPTGQTASEPTSPSKGETPVPTISEEAVSISVGGEETSVPVSDDQTKLAVTSATPDDHGVSVEAITTVSAMREESSAPTTNENNDLTLEAGPTTKPVIPAENPETLTPTQTKVKPLETISTDHTEKPAPTSGEDKEVIAIELPHPDSSYSQELPSPVSHDETKPQLPTAGTFEQTVAAEMPTAGLFVTDHVNTPESVSSGEGENVNAEESSAELINPDDMKTSVPTEGAVDENITVNETTPGHTLIETVETSKPTLISEAEAGHHIKESGLFEHTEIPIPSKRPDQGTATDEEKIIEPPKSIEESTSTNSNQEVPTTQSVSEDIPPQSIIGESVQPEMITIDEQVKQEQLPVNITPIEEQPEQKPVTPELEQANKTAKPNPELAIDISDKPDSEKPLVVEEIPIESTESALVEGESMESIAENIAGEEEKPISTTSPIPEDQKPSVNMGTEVPQKEYDTKYQITEISAPAESVSAVTPAKAANEDQEHVQSPDQTQEVLEQHAVDNTEGHLTIESEDSSVPPVHDSIEETKPAMKPGYLARPITSTLAPQGSLSYPDRTVSGEDNGHFPINNGTYLNPESDDTGDSDDYEGDDLDIYGPGTCRYGGKVYVSAQQIPRDDPCDFCFCFRSDIICLQQSCPPPIPGCHEEPINGFCCPRYECPVSMATSLNLTTTTTTTTTTLPPHFLSHAYKGAARRSGCQIRGQAYRVGETIPSASGPCLQCSCGGDGNMKCEPRVCSPEPMLRQMIAAATAKRRR